MALNDAGVLGTTNAGNTADTDLFLAATLNAMIHENLVDKTSLRMTATNYGLLPGGSTAHEIASATYNDAMGAVTAEDTDVSATQLETGVATITVARRALRRDATDLYDVAGGPRPGLKRLAQDMSNAASLALTDLIAASFTAGAASTVGATGTALTVDTVYDAQFGLIQALVPGPYHCVLHPDQFVEFQDSLRGEGGAAQFNAETGAMLSIGGGQGYGRRGEWNGITFWTADSVPTDATDYSGAMYGAGFVGFLEAVPQEIQNVAAPGSFAAQTPEGAPIFVEFERDASLGRTQVVGNYFVGVSVIEAARGIEILSID